MSDWNVVDLFSGIGGFALGLERAGMSTVAFCDNNPKCRHLLKSHWPDVPCFDDVSTMTSADVPQRVRLICGGFPCQDVSLAGPGGGLDGLRSGLWREYARLIREFRPDFVVVENVSALLGRGLGVVLGDLAALGFDAWWDCIPASAVGAPHRRDRVWIVAYPRGQQYEGFGDALRREIAARLPKATARARHVADSQGISRRAGLRDNGPGELGGLFAGDGGRDVAVPSSVGRVEEHPNPRGRREGSRAEQGARPRGRGRQSELADPVSDHVEGFVACVADQEERGGQVERPARSRSHGIGQWSVEPDVGRVANGVPARVDRLHGLGNAVVPQIPEIIGAAIIAAATVSDASATDKG